MSEEFDVVVIGSGFGGSVLACRMAQKGYGVLVLERGRRWQKEDYPSVENEDWIWDQDEPEKQNGWIDLRLFRKMAVAQGAGVGGGSLIYANIFVEAEDNAFDGGWPADIRRDELDGFYRTTGNMVGVSPLPDTQLTKRFELMRDAAQKAGHGKRFRKLPIAVNFDKNWNYKKDDRFNVKHSKITTNRYGKKQGTCIHCGNCDIGCPVLAKNTLDLNYLAVAEKHGAQIRPLHMVTRLEQTGASYQVHFDRLEDGRRTPGAVKARMVFLAAGSLGSTELLLRCRDEYKTLPDISARLGHGWSSNGDFLTPDIYKQREISPTQGPTITCAIDFLDGKMGGHEFFVEDGGFPDIFGNMLEELQRSALFKTFFGIYGYRLGRKLRGRDPLQHVMPWFGQGVDAADGRLRLKPKLFSRKKALSLDWNVKRSRGVIEALIGMHKTLSQATGGDVFVPPTWKWFKYLITPHPLGGCNMAGGPDKGVVDSFGRVFGHKNLYVVDGAIVPRALGLNPSRTIAALAERIADSIPRAA